MNYNNFYCLIFWTQLCKYHQDQKYHREAKCGNTPKLYTTHPKNLWSVKLLLTIVNLYQHANNQFILSVHSSNTVNFRVPSPDWPQSVLITLTSKIFNHLLILMNLYQHAKSQLIPSVHYSDTINFRVQRPD